MHEYQYQTDKVAWAAQRVAQTADEFASMRRHVDSLLGELAYAHKGDTANAYRRLLNQWITDFGDTHGQLVGICQKLGGTANLYHANAQQEQDGVNALNHLLNQPR